MPLSSDIVNCSAQELVASVVYSSLARASEHAGDRLELTWGQSVTARVADESLLLVV